MNVLMFVTLFTAFAGTTHSIELAESVEAEKFSVCALEKIRNAIEKVREQMHFGFPELGVPVLDPIRISLKNIELSVKDTRINGTLFNLQIKGLSKFKINNLKLNIIRNTLYIQLTWNHLSIETLYNLWLELSKRNYETKAHRSGSANIDLKGLTMKGDIKYSLNLIKGKLELKQLKLYSMVDGLSLDMTGLASDEALSHELSIMLEYLILSTIKNNPEKIAEINNDILLPIFNDILARKSFDDLIGIGKESKQSSLPKGEEATNC